MNNSKQSHGVHTWDIILHYYRCPLCGYIMENQTQFERRLQNLQKELCCSKCKHFFTITKNKKPTFGPLLGHDTEVAD